MEWYNEPPEWTTAGDVITVKAGAHTDFWRKTHDGGIRDTGNFYWQPVSGNFVAEVKITGEYATLYDQAGLMVRLDEKTWMKCGIEFFQDVQHVSVVVTREFSDWSVIRLAQNPESIWMRVVRTDFTLEVYYSLNGSDYTMLRQAYLSPQADLQVGVMVAAPIGDGFKAKLEGFHVQHQ